MANKHAATDARKPGVWQRTPTPNLIRYGPAGTYYLRARFRGAPVRECLHTDNYRVACVKLAERMGELRAANPAASDAPDTLQEALALVRARVANDPSLKANTRRSYFEELDDLKPGWPAAVPATPLRRLKSRDLEIWWKKAASAYSPQRANHLLMFVRRAMKLARKTGAMSGDPSEELKRVKIPRTRLNLLTVAQFKAIVESVRAQGKARSQTAADWMEFMAYSGLRPKELREVLMADVSEETGTIRVTGGAQGTKNREERHVPMIPPMRDLLNRMREAGRLPKVGRLFDLTKPHDALRNVCIRLGFPHQRIYDLRHLFASTCNESGVDVPTFAKWLGHKDGGALAMKVYVHPSDEHSERAAAKVGFR